jgi:myosin heavy subunit
MLIFFFIQKKPICLIILDLIESKTTGCFDLLDEESKLPTPRSEHFTTEIHSRNKGHPRLDVTNQIKKISLFFVNN